MAMKTEKKNPFSFQLDVSDFLPPTGKRSRASWSCAKASALRDGLRRFKRNKIAMVSLAVIIFVMIFAFIMPEFYPYSYDSR
jgi:oligopeptide transport system permease protein